MSPDLGGLTIITGTDTDVGKTMVTAALAAHLTQRGLPPVVCKPAQTGALPGQDADLATVGRMAALPPHRLIEWARLREPLAPTTAARRAGITLPSVSQIAERLLPLAAAHPAVLVEGAGGLLVGLDNDGAGLLELADALVTLGTSPRFIVVTRPGLGTLNHTALTVQAIRASGHHLDGLVVGSWPEHPSLAERCNAVDLARIAPILAALPEGLGQGGATTPDTLAAAWGTVPASFAASIPKQEAR